MPVIPAALLKKLYVKGSLKNVEGGVEFALRNTLAPGTIVGFAPVEVDGQSHPLEDTLVGGQPAGQFSAEQPLALTMNATAVIHLAGAKLSAGSHRLVVAATTKEIGEIRIETEDSLS